MSPWARSRIASRRAMNTSFASIAAWVETSSGEAKPTLCSETPMVTRPLSGRGEGVCTGPRKKKRKIFFEIRDLFLSLFDLAQTSANAAPATLILLTDFYAIVASESKSDQHSKPRDRKHQQQQQHTKHEIKNERSDVHGERCVMRVRDKSENRL